MTEEIKDQNDENAEEAEETSEATVEETDAPGDASEASEEVEAEASEASEAEEAEAEAEAEASEVSEGEEAEAEASEVSEAEEAETSEAEGEPSEADEAPEALESPNEVETLDLSREAQETALEDAPKENVAGIAAFFDHPGHLLYAAEQTAESDYESFDALSPFPIHGMDDALGGRSWIPWVTFIAGSVGFCTAVGMEFGIMGYDWPMVYGGKAFIAWPAFVPIMFELTVLLAGVTTAFVMLIAAGCFRKPFIIDPDITNDRFVLWISSDDERFNRESVIEFMKDLNPSEIRTVSRDQ